MVKEVNGIRIKLKETNIWLSKKESNKNYEKVVIHFTSGDSDNRRII